jgi:hypothetical protein
MKIHTLTLALIASVALTLPSEAAKKRKKEVHRAPVSAAQSYPNRHSNDVYVSGEYVGRDPDPNIRMFMMRNPNIYDGPD